MIIILYLLIWLIIAFVWGKVVSKIIENKKYPLEEQNIWFWWGFFFGLIALIVALTKPDNHTADTNDYIQKDSWKCSKCGRLNPSYTGTCACGTDKSIAIKEVEDNDKLRKIKEYKELLENGIITQEEFDAKKKQLLGL